MKGRKPSSTRYLTRTGHRPVPDPIPVTDPDFGEVPADLRGLGLELWREYIADRKRLGLLNRLDRITLILACHIVMRAEKSKDPANIDIARRLLVELCATPASRLKLGSLLKSKAHPQKESTAISRSLDIIANEPAG
jgi:hypothetical protein